MDWYQSTPGAWYLKTNRKTYTVWSCCHFFLSLYLASVFLFFFSFFLHVLAPGFSFHTLSSLVLFSLLSSSLKPICPFCLKSVYFNCFERLLTFSYFFVSCFFTFLLMVLLSRPPFISLIFPTFNPNHTLLFVYFPPPSIVVIPIIPLPS